MEVVSRATSQSEVTPAWTLVQHPGPRGGRCHLSLMAPGLGGPSFPTSLSGSPSLGAGLAFGGWSPPSAPASADP